MKTFSLAFIFMVICTGVGAQAGMWTWVKGDSVINKPAVYGTQGVPSPNNNPPGLYEAAEWTDLQGNFWLFGGISYNANLGVGNSDLWKYNPVTNMWTWVKGPGTHSNTGSYGGMGIPDLSNNPPARLYCSASWTDLNGDLWLFGGLVSGSCMGDLWKYNIASNTWTWMKGSQGYAPATFGTQGVPAITNNPGSRCETSATWVDANNNLWFFGGLQNGCLSDLWRFNVATNYWTWMKGPTAANVSGNYGVKGVAAASNNPGARQVFSSWMDDSLNFWLFGGKDNGTNYFNDMWRYQPVSNNWTWMSGSRFANDTGQYGELCTSSLDYCPSFRFENRTRWKDKEGKFWVYGGGVTTFFSKDYSDLWCFDPVTLQWIPAHGDSVSHVAPVFGSLGSGAPGNTPGGRAGAVGWKDANGVLYLYGGAVDGWMKFGNDMWKFEIDTCCLDSMRCASHCQAFSVNISATQTIFCASGSTQICAPSSFANYLWNNGATTSCITTSQAGNYYVTVTDNTGCTAVSNHLAINVYPLPPVSISVSGDTLTAYNAVTYQWYLNGSAINGATNNIYIATQGGSYTVMVTDSNGCAATSTPVLFSGIENVMENDVVSIFPNPSTGNWQLEAGSNLLGGTAEVFDANGRVVIRLKIKDQRSKIEFDGARGVYLLRVSSPKGSVVRKLVRL